LHVIRMLRRRPRGYARRLDNGCDAAVDTDEVGFANGFRFGRCGMADTRNLAPVVRALRVFSLRAVLPPGEILHE